MAETRQPPGDRTGAASGASASGASASPNSLREALGALTRALSTAGSEVRREVAEELSAAAREVKEDLVTSKHGIVIGLAGATQDLKDGLSEAVAEVDKTSASLRARRDARTAKAERTRADLLAAARKVFAAQGYEGASVADLASAAGYTKGALYANFASKEDLFVEVVREQVAHQASSLDGHEAPTTTDISEILIGLEAYLFVHRHPGRRPELVEMVGGSFSGLARGVHAMRTGSDGEPGLVDERLGFALAALHSWAAIVAPVLPGHDLDATVEWLTERLVRDA